MSTRSTLRGVSGHAWCGRGARSSHTLGTSVPSIRRDSTWILRRVCLCLVVSCLFVGTRCPTSYGLFRGVCLALLRVVVRCRDAAVCATLVYMNDVLRRSPVHAMETQHPHRV